MDFSFGHLRGQTTRLLQRKALGRMDQRDKTLKIVFQFEYLFYLLHAPNKDAFYPKTCSSKELVDLIVDQVVDHRVSSRRDALLGSKSIDS